MPSTFVVRARFDLHFLFNTMRQLILFCYILGFSHLAYTQNYYGLGSDGVLYTFSASTCTVCAAQSLNGITPPELFFNGDIFVLPNGNVIITTNERIRVYDPPNPNPIYQSPVGAYSGMAAGPGGLVYMVNANSSPPILSTFNPTTNTLTNIGPFPSTVSSISDLFFVGSQLYAVGFLTVLAVNTTNPAASVPTGQFFNTDNAIADQGFFLADIFGQYNPVSGEVTNICTRSPGPPSYFISLDIIPAGAPQPAPCGGCTTNAGTLTTTPVNVCVPNSVSVPYNGNAVLDGNDLLQYAIVSSTSNPLSNIISVSNSPNILYNTAFTPGVTYYLATIAGNNSGGNVDLADACTDVSNLVPVVWRPRPSISLSTGTANLCAGACTAINLSFSGTPPFTANFSTPTGPVNQIYNNNSGVLNYCLPAGTPAGSVSVNTVSLTDQFCTCN
jgi:hypothetical protein